MNSDSYDLKNFSHSVGQNWYHVVLTPRARYPVFRQKHQRTLALEAFDWICARHKIDLFEKEVMDDHVHLFISCPPSHSVRRLIQIIKGGSSYYIRSKQPSLKKYPVLWSAGYFYRSVGSVSSESIKRYITESSVWSAFKQSKLM